jgi:predicted nucleic acid-binding protein
MRLFLDANVLFTAAHNPQGKAALVIELGQTGLWTLLSSRYAVEEARRNLARKYPDRLERLQSITPTLGLAPDSPSVKCPDGLVDKDCPIYRAALVGKTDILLTGDIRDFGFLMNSREKADGMLIQTVAEFLLRSGKEHAAYHLPAAASSLSRASTQRSPSGVVSFFQNGARVLR